MQSIYAKPNIKSFNTGDFQAFCPQKLFLESVVSAIATDPKHATSTSPSVLTHHLVTMFALRRSASKSPILMLAFVTVHDEMHHLIHIGITGLLWHRTKIHFFPKTIFLHALPELSSTSLKIILLKLRAVASLPWSRTDVAELVVTVTSAKC